MMHVDLAARARRLTLPRIPDADPLTPSGYLELRRKAAGLSERQLAERLAALYTQVKAAGLDQDLPAVTQPVDGYMLDLVHTLEAVGSVARHRDTLDAIAMVMPFDADIYLQLADAPPHRHPRICRGCGGSVEDVCGREDGKSGWESATQCTCCATGETARRRRLTA